MVDRLLRLFAVADDDDVDDDDDVILFGKMPHNLTEITCLLLRAEITLILLGCARMVGYRAVVWLMWC